MNKVPKKDLDLPFWAEENIPEELLGTDLFTFKVTLRTKDPETKKAKTITLDLLPGLALDRELVEYQLEELPTQYMFWSAVYSELRMNVAVLEKAVKIRKGKAIREIKQKLKDEGVNLTGEQVKVVVEEDSQLIRLEENLAKVQMHTGKVYHLVKALEMKADLGRSLSASKRQEFDKTT